ncbi:DUF2207 domain-containing protein [Sinosporangium siamense]|uniref:DUF2207 domain-containing protein n=1 Tax=Sinosporangium siamense TaxID=1367973 RepID=UPI001EF1A4C4|nr:DUF2207 domain-containing protein [Sinosporangium siamense]
MAAAVLAVTAHAGVPGGVEAAHDVKMELDDGGVLRVTERITHDFGSGDTITRRLLTRTRHDEVHDRVYHVTNVRGQGAVVDDETLTVRGVGRGTVTVSYDVTGAVAPHGEVEELRWFAAGGWNVPLSRATVTVTGPERIQSLSCFAGALTSAFGCTSATMDHTGSTATFHERALDAHHVLTVVVAFPRRAGGAVPILDRRADLATAFVVTPVTGWALATLAGLLLLGLGAVAWIRGRDARAHARVREPVKAPPGGVRPGQIGTLIGEQADVVDVTATIVDLAVRGHLRVEELPRQLYDAPDWVLSKGAPGELLPYERVLYSALFAGRESVKMSELRGSLGDCLGEVRDALYADVVKQGWFVHPPDSGRTRWVVAGVVLTAAGVPATALLAWLTHHGLLGLVLIIAGAAITVGAQLLPARSQKGAAALARAKAFREYFSAIPDVSEMSDQERMALFSRYLPYAVVFGELDQWMKVIPPATENTDWAWYRGPAGWDRSRFPSSIRAFTLTASGALSGTLR